MDQTGIPTTNCLVANDGDIVCVPSMKYIARCKADFSSWPYDKQKCVIKFGSWSHTGEDLSFKFDGTGV